MATSATNDRSDGTPPGSKRPFMYMSMFTYMTSCSCSCWRSSSAYSVEPTSPSSSASQNASEIVRAGRHPLLARAPRPLATSSIAVAPVPGSTPPNVHASWCVPSSTPRSGVTVPFTEATTS